MIITECFAVFQTGERAIAQPAEPAPIITKSACMVGVPFCRGFFGGVSIFWGGLANGFFGVGDGGFLWKIWFAMGGFLWLCFVLNL